MEISIIGLGWLGKSLSKYLIAKGYRVKGSTTSLEKCSKMEQDGVHCVRLKLSPYPEGNNFQQLFKTDLLIINVPPKSRTLPDSFHPEQIKFLKSLIQQGTVKKVIYISATSVYPDENREVDEEEPLDEKNCPNRSLYDAEKLLWKDKDYDLTVIRFGGLLGMDRIPGRYFSGKEDVSGEAPVNYIHQTDAVRMIHFVIEKDLWNETFNGVSPLHPKKREVYEKNAKDLRIAPPKSYLAEEIISWKQVSASKIQSRGFSFVYNNPLLFDYTPFY